MAIVVGLDLGTSKLCAIALDVASATVLATRSARTPGTVEGLPPGRHEQDAGAIRDACGVLVHELAASPEVDRQEVCGIGIAGQMHGVLLADAEGRATTRLFTWRDQRGAEGTGPGSLAWAASRLPEGTRERVGCGLHPGYGGLTMHWLATNGAGGAQATALSLADYVAAGLTGVAATEPTHAASWGLYDLAGRQWAWEAADALGIPRGWLPVLRPSGGPLAELLPGACRALGLPRSAVVCSPVGDSQAAAFAALWGARGAGVANLGTGAQVCIPTLSPARAEPFETRPMPDGSYLLVGASLCGGWAYAYIRGFLQAVAREVGGVDLSDEEAYARVGRLAEEAPVGANGLRVDPRFAGARGDASVRGAITAIGEGNLTASNLARAVLEGVARELGELWRAAEARPQCAVASGNAVRRNPILLGILERELAVPVGLSLWGEEAAVGAALLAAQGLGLRPGGRE